MTNYMAGLIAILALCVLCVISAPAANDESVQSQETLRYLRKYVEGMKLMSDTAESVLDKLARGEEVSIPDMAKRQGAWDMDYGWGGGRFGKRNNNQQGAKRYDVYGISGRFGRDVNRAQAQQLHNDDHQ